HWFNEFQRGAATAGRIGQVFGVALDDASPPNIYLTATSAFGLHRNAGNTDWMAGMWGTDGGPGTVWKLDAANGYQPEVFARIALEGRPNSGAALGNIAFDARNRQLYVSDLETGMIHRLRLSDGADLGTFDHGTQGRTSFFDTPSGQYRALASVPFDPAMQARIDDCPSGDFARTPSCWNFADFRRRVWGLGVRFDPATEETRLYYATWSSQGFGSPDFAGADDDEQKNALWSVAIAPDSGFDLGSVRREFLLPDFFRSPEAIARAGRSHPVSDIAFPAAGEPNVMLLAERGGVRNLGLAADNAFAYPNEARVLRYELTGAGTWRGAGRYDVGYYDRGEDGPPYIRAGAAGGVSFGPGYGESWDADPALQDAFVWMTGDGLCSPRGLCFDSSAGEHNDSSQVTGVQGRAARPYDAFEPITAFQPYPAPGPVTPPSGPDSSFMVDADVNTDAAGNAVEEELQRNDATRVGDIAVFQPLQGAGEELPPAAEPEIAGWPEGLPPEGWIPAPPPDDGWFPPPPFPFNSDLAIRKTGPAQCQEGVECTYTIRIRNLGALAYIGPLAIEDTMPAGATLASTSPGWNCFPAGVTFRCITNAPALLVPGATAAIEVNLLLPADVPGPTVINCAAIDWFEMGTDDGPDGNDQDCVETPVIAGFDLGIFKSGPVNCTENADCTFLVQVVNFGPGEFNGAIAVRDPLPAGTTLVVAGFDPGTVTCAPSGGDVLCQTPDMTLPVGGMVPILLRIKLPDGIAGGTIENCALIDWGLMTANDGAADIHPDQACYTANVLDGAGFFDLSVTKQGPAHCDAGGNCTYQITVINNGPDDYNGEIVLRDTPEPGVTLAGANPGWTCLAGPPIDCTLNGGPHTLHPGDSRSLTLTVAIPNPAPANPMLNCIALNWGAGGMPPDDNPAPGSTEESDDICVPTFANAGFDLEIAKTGPAECYEGGACDFTVSVTNNGPMPFVAFMAFDDVLPAGSTLEGVTGAFSCSSAAPGTLTCNTGGIWFLPGATQDVEIHTRLPDPVIGDTAVNCAAMNWAATPPAWYIGATYTGDDNPATDGPACVAVPVLAADLAPWGATSCELGSACAIDVRIENRGGRLFKGAAGLRGTLDPGVAISSIKSGTPGLDCQVTGTGLYECEARELTLKPGTAAEIQLVLQIPEDFPHRRIVHRKEMIWPDAEVKDAKPQNDRHTSTIMIVQPQEAEDTRQPEEPVTPPPPPPPQLTVADLAVTKTAQQRSCVAGETCEFLVRVTNTGRVGYTGPLRVSDDISPSSRLVSFGPRPWRCSAEAGEYACTHPVTTLAPGESRLLSLGFIPGRGGMNSLRNCAALDWSEASRVMAVQNALNQLGFAAGSADGQAGPRTRSAIRAFQESAGLPINGRIDAALLRRLFVSWGTGDANAANDNNCVAIGFRQPVEPPPVCARGQTEIPLSRVKTLQAQGWRIDRVTSGGQTIYCGTPPPPPVCARGQTEIPASRVKTLQAQGWQIGRVTRGGQTIYCGTPPAPEVTPLTCPPGYRAYESKRQIPPNSEVIQRTRGNEVLYCARPLPQVDRCPGGWTQVNRNRAKELVQQGWEIQQVGSLLCARPGIRIEPVQPQIPTCTGGRVWDPGRNSCVCPGNAQWDEKQGRCVAPPVQLQRVVPQPGLRITPAPK
ncbi:MAG: DUF11 domain-containing protein, partial [Notoacmeibacter sp.]|nr:DUF11 domain-containing protein [Notoacmeibacter sp.]